MILLRAYAESTNMKSKILKLKRVSKFLKLKRLIEYAWAWEIKPIFGGSIPSTHIIVKVNDYYVILDAFIFQSWSEMWSFNAFDEHFLSVFKVRARWSKTIHAYVTLPFATLEEIIDIDRKKLANPPKYVFSSYEEANICAFLQGVPNGGLLPFEDFGSCPLNDD